MECKIKKSCDVDFRFPSHSKYSDIYISMEKLIKGEVLEVGYEDNKKANTLLNCVRQFLCRKHKSSRFFITDNRNEGKILIKRK